MSTDLAVIEGQQAPALYTPPSLADTGLEDVARLKPTNIILVQPVTRDGRGAQPGQFLDVLTEQPFDKLNVVCLKVAKGRVLFPPGEDLNVEPLCRSNDGKVPSSYVKQPQCTSCAFCPYAQWKGDKRPECDEKIKLLMIVRSASVHGEEVDSLYGLPRYMSVGGVSIKPLKKHLDALLQDIKKNEALAKKGRVQMTSLFDYSFDITTEKVIGKRGVFYVMKFSNPKRVANVGEFGPFYEEFALHASHIEEEEISQHAPAKSEAAVDSAVEAEFVEITETADASAI